MFDKRINTKGEGMVDNKFIGIVFTALGVLGAILSGAADYIGLNITHSDRRSFYLRNIRTKKIIYRRAIPLFRPFIILSKIRC